MKTHVSLLVFVASLPACASTWAQIPTARVGDVTHLQGQGRNVLLGYGLVTGLDQTGDGGKFLPTMKALAEMLRRFGSDIETIEDVQASKNAAVVMLEAVIPEHGGREGELLDVAVTAVAAKSLDGGRLLPTPLVYHDRNVEGLFGFASGRIVVDALTPTTGLIREGARLEKDVFINVVATGSSLKANGISSSWIQPEGTYITLVLDDAHAGWSMAASVAQAVDKELGVSADTDKVALAVDGKNVIVVLPPHQRGDAASWIRDVERTPILMESGEARITINRRAGTIVVTGDTRMSPVIISQLGLTVSVYPTTEGQASVPVVTQQDFVPLDNEQTRQPNVRDLLEALNRLKVPFKDRVSILEEIHRSGKLHARMMYEG